MPTKIKTDEMEKFRFIIWMAGKDARKNISRLTLFMSSVIIGIAALVAINSFNYNLKSQIDSEAATLLGADMAITGNVPITDTLQKVVNKLPGKNAKEKELLSMAYIPSVNESQFIRLKAISEGFPFYGKIKTLPENVLTELHSASFALVEESLMLQHNLQVGDSIRLGKSDFKIIAKLTGGVGSISLTSAVAPSVYIGFENIDSTGLVQEGSLVNYAWYFSFPKDFDSAGWKQKNKKLFEESNFRIETIQDRKNNLNRGFVFLNSFLNLIAIIALLLGCLGVASGIWIYAKSKYQDIALLRCMGVKSKSAFMIYFIQILIFAVAGSIVGAFLGALMQYYLPVLFRDFLPLDVNVALSVKAISQGIVAGTLMSVLFALTPLASLQRVSPLHILRQSFESAEGNLRQNILYYTLTVIGLCAITFWLTGSLLTSLIFTSAILGFYFFLFFLAGTSTRILRKMLPENASFTIRQGMSNLFRPDNQTSTIIVTLGMGTAILATLIILQGILLKNISLMDEGNQPNMIIYGIESIQKEEIKTFADSFNLPVIQQVPIVTMRIEGWKGRSKSEWLADSTSTAEKWAFNREARVTYRDTLADGEKLLEGSLRTHSKANDSIFVSLGSTFAEAMDVTIGDELVFNIQGVRLKTFVGSIREIDFRNFSTRFFIVFPKGVIEDAPQFHVLVTKTPDIKTMSSFRAELIKKFPNVSAVDLSSVLQSVNEILAKVSFAIRFMALFSLLAGFIVLLGSLSMGKYQRIRESVILRTLGASKKRIISINFTEYLILACLAVGSGIILSISGSYLLSKFQFQLTFFIQWHHLALLGISIILITILMGILNSRSAIRSTPLEVLRKDVN